ncbi:MAG: DUF1667 domain-containing protein [Lachnospiraceae bacterium]|nr:DUF1667 domain-containing protein [Lachnospiraceae bacterium]
MTRELTCICCPIGCSITVEMNGNEVAYVSGNNCPRGDAYVRKEVTAPQRTVTTTVAVDGGESAAASVKTQGEIPKEKIMECIKALRDLHVEAPVHIGDVILKNVADTGVDIVATSNIAKG